MLSDEKMINKSLITIYCSEYNINYNELADNDKNKFRYVCFKYNQFMKHVPLPNIKLGSIYEAVFIEFRILPNIEFIIRNAILKLGKSWSFSIVCGNTNYHFIKQIASTISKNINIIKLDYDNMTRNEYSNFLMTSYFWDLFKGEKILIYQEDSLILQKNIMDFIQYDFIGAPFPKGTDDTPNGVGNGGLSLRTKSKMIEVIKKCPITDDFCLGNLLYNLQFFIDKCVSSNDNFISVFQSYINFLEDNNYNLYKHRDTFLCKYETYGIIFKSFQINNYTNNKQI